MIYLIDDKKLRQEKDFGWTSEKFSSYSYSLIPIYTLEDLTNNAKEVFNENNTVLYHESFIDNSGISAQSAIKRSQLDELAQKYPSFNLVIFSGSKNTRNVNKNVAHLPVSVVYQNLAIFTEKYSVGDINLNYLSFGEKPEIESLLLEMLESAITKIELEPVKIPEQKNLFISTFRRKIQDPIVNASKATLFDEDDDNELTTFIQNNLCNAKYDNLYIPLCFGRTLSDFNGLRLATHIRCTESPNQLSRIFIYGFVGIEYLFQDQYFNILKTKNVELIGFSKKALQEAANTKINSFIISELPVEIKKLKLDLPENYEDSHSIANEWAIYRWSNTIDAEDYDIEKIINQVNSNIYFKYLCTLYPKNQIIKLHGSKLKFNFSGSPKILYIDDEADKGWSEILCKIIYDINKISYAYLGKELKSQSSEEIITSSLEKIINDDFDLVILDFRLHVNDFNAQTIQDVTGLKLLKEIKKTNPGIQVIILSATNKIWNLLELQKAGADGFILKESPENSTNKYFTIESIERLVDVLTGSVRRTFLKQIFKELLPLTLHLNKLHLYSPKVFGTKDFKISKGKIPEYIEFVKSCASLLLSNPFDLKYAYLQLILIIEDVIKAFYIEDENRNHIVELSMFERIVVLERKLNSISMKLEPINRWTKFIKEEYTINHCRTKVFIKDYLGNTTVCILMSYENNSA